MRKNLFKLGAALLLAGGTVLSSSAAVSLVTLEGHVPAVVSHLSATGTLPATNMLHLSIGLPLRNTDALSNLLQQIYDPASTNYHKYLTPEEFTIQFGPTEEDYQSVIDYVKANGLAVTDTHPNRMLLDVSGKAADVQTAFHVALHQYQNPADARVFYAPDVNPSVPSTLSIKEVSGLDNYRQPFTKFKMKPVVKNSNSVSNVTPQVTANLGSGPAGSYMGDDFRTAYAPGTRLNGSGQTVALVQFDGYLASDIEAYASMAGRTNIPLQNILIDGFSGVPTSNNGGGEVEVSLDIEMLIAMAPALSQILVYEGNPFNFHPNDVLNRIATDNMARQISCSWGWTGGPSGITDQIFQQMALQGQTFYDASGDSDAFTAGAGSVNGVDSPFIPNAPSSSPYITQVGGTTLSTSGAGGTYTDETVWNWGTAFGADGVGSSGGISSFYSIPTWQTNINYTLNQGSTTFRNIPDVALTADNIFVIADGGTFYPGTGGTSCAAPLWAGFTALINQQGTANGRAAIGFINPALYAIAAGTNYANCFHDITTGNNTWSSSPNLFPATTNYDLCTGLGTPNGTNLINALVPAGPGGFTNPITHISPPLPPFGYTLSALNGDNPNGNWELFVQDDTKVDSGIISNGWSLTLTMASPVGMAADQAITMTPSATFVAVGNYIVYSITVTNYGPTASTNVIVTDTLPAAGSTFVSANATAGIASRSGSTVTWNVGALASGAGAGLVLTLQANSAGSLLNYALVNSDTSDPNPDDDVATSTVTVGTIVAPQLTPGATVGGNGSFQFGVTGSPVPTIIQANTNLVTTNWISLYTNTPPFIFTNFDTTNVPMRFYRAVTSQ